jgi:inositol phosphorylceramide mannosyltransferase catalytic subunit
MESLDFDDLDRYLLAQNGRIIHQVWFSTGILHRRESAKAYAKLKNCRDSWKIKNPTWCHIEWNRQHSMQFMKDFYPEHFDMYRKYKYEIQRCDVVRYFFLHRYGGLYADMDYYCNKPFDEALQKYSGDLYLVKTPNGITDHVSNSLMYSKPGHVYWKKLFMKLEQNKVKYASYYQKHIIVMYTTGPGIVSSVFNEFRIRHSLQWFPSNEFHPFGISDDIKTLANKPDVYAIHLGKGSWEKGDSKFLIFLFRDWKIVIFIIAVMLIATMISI